MPSERKALERVAALYDEREGPTGPIYVLDGTFPFLLAVARAANRIRAAADAHPLRFTEADQGFAWDDICNSLDAAEQYITGELAGWEQDGW